VHKIMAALIGGAVRRNRFYGLDTTAIETDLARAGGRVTAKGKLCHCWMGAMEMLRSRPPQGPGGPQASRAFWTNLALLLANIG
jgi:hypothetical protein